MEFSPTAPAEHNGVLNTKLQGGTAGDLITWLQALHGGKVIRSPAVEQMPPAAYVPVCTMSGTRLLAPLRMAYPWARFGTGLALSQYIERDIPSGAKIRCSRYSSYGTPPAVSMMRPRSQ